jgi:hypothetical protein
MSMFEELKYNTSRLENLEKKSLTPKMMCTLESDHLITGAQWASSGHLSKQPIKRKIMK